MDDVDRVDGAFPVVREIVGLLFELKPHNRTPTRAALPVPAHSSCLLLLQRFALFFWPAVGFAEVRIMRIEPSGEILSNNSYQKISIRLTRIVTRFT
jgi:hypothetical protein